MSLTYSVEIPQLAALAAAFANAPQQLKPALTVAVNRSLMGYQATAKQLAPIDKGVLRGSIQIQAASWSGDTVTGSVGTGPMDYALYMEQGTGIYGPTGAPITPKNKKVLAWFADGQWRYAKSVKGVKPHWYMRGSVEQNQAKTEGYFQDALDQVAGQIASGA